MIGAGFWSWQYKDRQAGLCSGEAWNRRCPGRCLGRPMGAFTQGTGVPGHGPGRRIWQSNRPREDNSEQSWPECERNGHEGRASGRGNKTPFLDVVCYGHWSWTAWVWTQALPSFEKWFNLSELANPLLPMGIFNLTGLFWGTDMIIHIKDLIQYLDTLWHSGSYFFLLQFIILFFE